MSGKRLESTPVREPMPREITGKVKRVLGIFTLMVGAGIVLESAALWAGTIVMVAGMGTFLWGIAGARPKETAAVRESESPPTPATTRPTESRL